MRQRWNAMKPPMYEQWMRRFDLSGIVSSRIKAECRSDDIQDDMYEPAEQSAAAENVILSSKKNREGLDLILRLFVQARESTVRFSVSYCLA